MTDVLPRRPDALPESTPAQQRADLVATLTSSRWLLFSTLGLLALLLRLACMNGLVGSDDLGYIKYAQALADGTYHATIDAAAQPHHALRYGVIMPVAASFRLFGVSEFSTILLPLLASTLSVVLLAEIGRLMFGMRVALIVGLLYATFPMQLIIGTILLPEPFTEFYLLVGVICYLHARERGGVLWVLAGLSMGIAYVAKEPALFVGGAFLLHALWERRWRGAALFAAGVAAVGTVEHAYYLFWRGDILFRPHATRLYNLPAADDFFTPIQSNLWYRLLRKYPQTMLVPHLKFGLHSVAALVLSVAAISLKPRRGFLLLVLWVLVPFLYLNFGSWSFSRYAPLPADPRYIELIYPPLFLLSAVALIRAFEARGTLATAATGVLALVLTGGVVSGFLSRGTIAHAAEIAVLREVVRAAGAVPGQTLHTDDPRWSSALAVLAPAMLSPSPEGATFVITPDPLGLPAVRYGSGAGGSSGGSQ